MPCKLTFLLGCITLLRYLWLLKVVSVQRAKEVNAFVIHQTLLWALAEPTFCNTEVLLSIELMNGSFVLYLREAEVEAVWTPFSNVVVFSFSAVGGEV